MIENLHRFPDSYTLLLQLMMRPNRHKAITFKIEGTEVVPAEKIDSADFDDFLGALPESDGRFCVVDFSYETSDGRPTDKVVFVSWIPDTCKVRVKMTYSGTKEAVKSAFVGISVNINATDMSEVTQEIVREACTKV